MSTRRAHESACVVAATAYRSLVIPDTESGPTTSAAHELAHAQAALHEVALAHKEVALEVRELAAAQKDVAVSHRQLGLEVKDLAARIETLVASIADVAARVQQGIAGLARTDASLLLVATGQLALAGTEPGVTIASERGLRELAAVVLPAQIEREDGTVLTGELRPKRVSSVDGRTQLDLWAPGERKGEAVEVMGEVIARIHAADVREFADRIRNISACTPARALPVLFGFAVDPAAWDLAQELGVLVVASRPG